MRALSSAQRPVVRDALTAWLATTVSYKSQRRGPGSQHVAVATAAAAATGGVVAALVVQLHVASSAKGLRSTLTALEGLAKRSGGCRLQLAAAAPELQPRLQELAASSSSALSEAARSVLALACAQ